MRLNTIETENLLLRPIQITDTEEIHSYAGDPSIDMMMFLPKESLDETKQFVEYAIAQWEMDEPEDREYVITLNQKIIGGVNLERCDEENTYEIGWTINRNYRNNGYATEAANALILYAFNGLKAKRVQAHCDCRNIASEIVMKKIGMRLIDSTGTRYYPKNDITSGEYLYAIDKYTNFDNTGYRTF